MNTPMEHETRMNHLLAGLPLPASVKALTLALHEALQDAAVLEAKIIGIERRYAARCAVLTAEVIERRGEDGKPLATNDTIRKALIEQETAQDAECRRLLKELDALKRRKGMALADAEALRLAARIIGALSAPLG